MEHLEDIKFGNLGANTAWLTFSLANQPMQLVRLLAGSKVGGDLNLTILVNFPKPPN